MQKSGAALLVQLVLVAAVVKAVAGATPASTKQQPPAQQRSDNQRVNDLNKLQCERVRCNRDPDPVCATGRGVGGCTPPELGCTYTNGCMARCVYGVTVSYLGECTHKDAMRVVENDTPRKACQCDVKYEPVCARTADCRMPNGCTYASECYAKCGGATDIRKGKCPSEKGH